MITLFCHIGWMKNYQGETESDRLLGGGSYVQKQKTGHEICNFVVVDDRLYGYVQVGKAKEGKYQGSEINFRRLGALKGQDVIEGATIIWTATDPDGHGRKIVGWYREATLHRRYQNFSNLSREHEDNNISGYWISAPARCCVFPNESLLSTLIFIVVLTGSLRSILKIFLAIFQKNRYLMHS